MLWKTFLAVFAVATSFGFWPQGGAQKQTELPAYLVGVFRGTNLYRRASVTLTISGTGRVDLAMGAARYSGEYKKDTLEMKEGPDWRVRYVTDGVIDLTSTQDRRDVVRLRRSDRGSIAIGGDIRVISPRERDRIPSGAVRIEGTTGFADVFIEVLKDGKSLNRGSVPVRSGRFEKIVNLKPGDYELIVRGHREKGPDSERRFSFTVIGEQGNLDVHSPRNGDRLNAGDILFEGSTRADSVQIEVLRGRDRVWFENTRVRDGRFSSRITLGAGGYEARLSAREDGRTVANRTIRFQVERR